MIIKFQLLSLLIAVLTFSSCGKEEESSGLLGTWELKEIYISQGGVGDWELINTDKEVTFDAQGNYTSNGDMCGLSTASDIGSEGRWLANDVVLNFENCPDELSYEIISGELIIHFECIEQCSHKYRFK